MTSKNIPAPIGATQDESEDFDTRNDTLQRALVEDPLVRFVQKRWRAIVVVVLFMGAGIYVRNAFIETHEAALRGSGDLYSKIRTEYGLIQSQRSQLTELAKDQSEAGKQKFEAQKKQIQEAEAGLVNAVTTLSDSKEPYASIAALYQALLSSEPLREGRSESPPKDSPRQLVKEMERLVLAKRLLDIPEQRGEGLTILRELSENARYVHTVAAISYASIADGEQERTTARGLLEAVRAKHPEQGDLISAELDRLSGSVAVP